VAGSELRDDRRNVVIGELFAELIQIEPQNTS
jgi:hypothetical protein